MALFQYLLYLVILFCVFDISLEAQDNMCPNQ